MALFGKQGRDLGPAPDLSIADMQRLIAEARSNSLGSGSTMWAGEGEGSSLLDFSGGIVPQLQGILDYMTQNGLTNTSQVPEAYKRFLVPQAQTKTFGGQVADYITNPAVLTAIGGVAGVYAGGAASAAGAGSGSGGGATVGGLTAAEEAAMLGAASTSSGGGAAATGAAATGATTVGGTAGASMGGSAGGATTGGSAATTAAQNTALSRILSGAGTSADYMTVFGQVAPSLLGMYASDKQADALNAQAARYEAMGAPYRDRLGALYSDPTAFLNSPEVKVPVQLGTDALARSLSTQGNPAGSGSALQQLQSYASDQLFSRLGQEKDRLGGFGGLTAYNQAAPQLGAGAINAERGYYDALGYGVGQVTNPPRSLQDMLRQYNMSQGLT